MKRTRIVFGGKGLGDTIAWMGQVERYQELTNNQVDVICSFSDIFKKQNIKTYPRNQKTDASDYDYDFLINTYDYKRPSGIDIPVQNMKVNSLIGRASQVLGLPDAEERKPTLGLKLKKIKLKRRAVSLASLSTFQKKLWNYKGGWNEVNSYLKKKNIDVISLDKHSQFGAGYAYRDSPAYNPIPSNSIDKTGQSLRVVASYIDKSLFFMGLSSGIAWLAWALNKPVIMVAGFLRENYHFSTPYYVQDTSVCHNCWSHHNLPIGEFKEKWEGGWYWCPENKNFECSRKITPEMVIEKIDELLV
ncbi:hypothetical protein CMI37_28655 [Candidatus Pacearchaeota archaeon]|nr:hypothetical protein [Candidatus Pacearchaeota archaeon]|tara:strand:+ start:4835 stop:5743 length:909 start_codon:yes stop_codon:yes gene_type:complete